MPVTLEEEMRRSYLDYAMSVIVARALPDARDGLKPVHRRILYAMQESGYTADKPHRKSARVVGDVMGKYHPHGDAAIYDAMVRMAQSFSMRVPLIDGQGNFGSHGRRSAGGRCATPKSRLAQVRHALLDGHRRRTRSTSSRTTTSARGAEVLPAAFPNLLVNGAGGIAVGMATNIPPHNLGEVIDATPGADRRTRSSPSQDLMEIVPGPDFPTGGLILGRAGIRVGLSRRAAARSRCARSARSRRCAADRQAIIVTEIPYQVNKSTLIEKIAELVRDKRDRGHLRPARRERPRRHAHRHRAEARRDGRGGAEPAVPL